MADYQELVDRVRNYLASDDREPSNEAQSLATELASAIAEVNQRLRRCGEYLRQGLRSEAIHLAEAEPNLLDSMSILDTLQEDERAQWKELVQFFEYPIPDPLLVETAELINEAYLDQEPLQKLLSQHRLMALQRAPLADRLALLRRLADEDVDGTMWDKDLAEYEQARLDEIANEVKRGGKSFQLSRLDAIVAEVSSSDWRSVKPPAKLVSKIKALRSTISKSQYREQLKNLERELNECLNRQDIEAAKPLYQQWQQISPKAKLSPDDSILEQASPALGWVEDQLQQEETDASFVAAVQALEFALEGGNTSLEDLERLGGDCSSYNRDLPPELVTRYRNRIDSLRTVKTRKTAVIGIVAVMLLIGVGAGVFTVIQYARDASLKNQTIASLESSLGKGNLEEAAKTLEPYADRWATEDWVDIRDQVAKAQRDRNARKQKIDDALYKAEKTPLSSNDVFERHLAVAKQSAEQDPHPTLLVDDVRRRVSKLKRLRSEQKGNRDKEFRVRLDDVASLVESLKAESKQEISQLRFDRLSEQVRTECQLLRTETDEISPSLVTKLSLIETQFNDVVKVRNAMQKRKDVIDEIVNATFVPPSELSPDNKLEIIRSRVKNFAASNPEDRDVQDFSKLVEAESKVWEAALRWQNLLRQWTRFTPASPGTVQLRIDSVDKYLKAYPTAPDLRNIQDYQTHLKMIQGRRSSSGAIAKLKQVMIDDPLMSKAFVLKVRSEDSLIIYYVDESKSFAGNNSASFKYYIDDTGRTANTTVLANKLVATKATTAPQQSLVKLTSETIGRLKVETWEPEMLQLSLAVRGHRSIDPVLQFAKLTQVLKLAAAGSFSLKKTLGPIVDSLEDSDADPGAPWMNPKEEKLEDDRQEALNVLKGVTEVRLRSAFEQAEKEHQKLIDSAFQVRIPIGICVAGDNGSTQIRTPQAINKLKGTYTVHVVVPAKGSGGNDWKPIGKIEEGKLTQPSPSSSDLKPGRLVFGAREKNKS